MKRIRSGTAEKKWRHRFSHYKPMGILFRCSRAANSAVSGPSRPKFKLVRALMHVIITCKYEKDRMINRREKVETPFFSITTLWELSVAIETRVLIRSDPKPNAAFPPTQWCFRYNLFAINPLVSEIFMFESVNTRTHARTDRRTPARLVYYKLTSEPSAQVSQKTNKNK